MDPKIAYAGIARIDGANGQYALQPENAQILSHSLINQEQIMQAFYNY